MTFEQNGVIFSSFELEILKWPIFFGTGGRLDSDMLDEYCRNKWTMAPRY